MIAYDCLEWPLMASNGLKVPLSSTLMACLIGLVDGLVDWPPHQLHWPPHQLDWPLISLIAPLINLIGLVDVDWLPHQVRTECTHERPQAQIGVYPGPCGHGP